MYGIIFPTPVPDVDELLEEQRRRMAEVAGERSRVASELLQQQRQEERERVELAARRQQCVRTVEELRAALVRRLPSRKDKQPLAEVSLNIQPAAKTGKNLAQPAAVLGKGYVSCCCSTARLCECLAKQVPASERVAQASPHETPATLHGKASSTSLFALDSRVSLVPPGDHDPRLHGADSPPLMAHVGETHGEPSQQTCPRTISPICSSAGAIPQNQNDEVCRPSQTREQRLPSSGPSGTTVATSRVSAGQRTAASQADHKVHFYDYSSRFEKEAEARYTVRRHDSAEVGRGSAMEAAQLEYQQQQAAHADREALLSRQSERSQLALARERLHADYQRLLQQLPAIARASAKRLPAAVHLTDERRQQKEALRQSNMASVFERLHHSLLEADNTAAPYPRRTSVTISPQPPDEETPPKLNVAGMCARSTGGGLEEGNLAAALENLHARLEQQRALLRSEGGAEERAEWVSEDVQHVSTTQHIGRKVCKRGRLHLYEPVTGQADTQSAGYEGNYYKNKQEGGLKSVNQDTAQNNNTKYKHLEDKQEDILRNKQRDGERERTLKDGHQVDKREGRMKDGHQENKREGRMKDGHQENKREGRLKGGLQEDKRGGRVYDEHQEDKHEERSVVRHMEGKHKGRLKDKHQEDKEDGRLKDKHQEDKREERSVVRHMEGKHKGRSKDRHQEDKEDGRLKDKHQEDKREERSVVRHMEGKHKGRSKDRHQEDKEDGRLKDRHQEDKREGGSKDRHHDNKHKNISKDWPQEEKLKDRYQEPEQERGVKHRHHNNEQEGQHDDRSKCGNQEQRKTSKEKNHKMKCDDSSNKRGHKCRQKYRSSKSDEDEYRHRSQEQKQESGGGRSRDSSHEGSELTVVSEYSLDVSRSKCAEVNQSSMNSSEQSSSNSMRVYEDMKLQLNVKEVIRSPCRESSQPLHWKHTCRKSVDVKRCSKKKLQMVEEGTQTSASPRDGEEPSAAGDSRADKTVLESSGSTAYLSPPQQLAGEHAEVIDQLMYAVQHQKDEVEGPHQEPNPTLLLYIARLLSMSRASVEDLSVVSSPTPQGTPCKCLDGDTNRSEHENEKTVPSPRSPRTKGIPPRPPKPATVPPVTCPESCTSQAVCQSAPVLSVPTTSSSQGVVYTEVSALPTYKQPQTKVTSAVGEPKMCSLPTDSHVLLPETCIASSILLPEHKSFEESNSDVNGNSTSQNLCDHSSLRDGSLGMGSANHWSSNGSWLENSIQNYPEFQDKYTTISMQYSERISDILAQIQSVRAARMKLESSSSDSDQTVMLSPSLVSPLVPPSDTVASSVMTVPGSVTWREALGGETSSQQRGRQPRQKPPSALERSRLMTGTHTCGPSHELSTIVEVDTPQSSHAFPSTTADRPRSADSDDTLPDVAAEMVRRGLVSASFWQGEGQPSGPGVQDLESALAGLGMSWAGSTLRKVREAEQLSSTSSETASAARRYSPPEDVRARSTPVPPAPSICFPSESDVSTIHPSPESLDIQAPELSLQRTSLQNHYQAHWEKPPQK